MKTLYTLAFIVLGTTLNAITHNLTNYSNLHKDLSLSEHKSCLQSSIVELKDNEEQSKQLKISNGTGDPVMHGVVLGTAAVQTGILSSTGSGLALSLPGDNDYVSISNSSELQFGSQDFTVEFWVKLNSQPDFNDIIIGKWQNIGSEGSNEWAFGLNGGSPYFVTESGYSQSYLIPF